MEIDAMLFWNIILTMVVVPFGWAFNKMFQEVKRIQILLNKTREEYARKDDVKDDMHDIMDAMKRFTPGLIHGLFAKVARKQLAAARN